MKVTSFCRLMQRVDPGSYNKEDMTIGVFADSICSKLKESVRHAQVRRTGKKVAKKAAAVKRTAGSQSPPSVTKQGASPQVPRW